MADLDTLALVQHVGRVTTAAIARHLLGSDSARTANLWCRRHKIQLTRDGKYLWADLEAVKKAIAPATGARSYAQRIMHGS